MLIGFWASWGVTILVTLVFIVVLRRLAPKLGLVDFPGGRKQHAGEIPLVGGIALFLGFTVGCLTLYQSLSVYRAFFVCAIILILLGIADDLRELSALWRLMGQLVVAIVAIIWGDALLTDLGDLFCLGPIHLKVVGIALSLIAIVGFINAFNMLDGNDGLCGSLALVQLGYMALLAGLKGQYHELFPIILLCTAIVIFLCFNFPFKKGQASVFMGDSGSMLLGFAVAWYAIRFSQGDQPLAQPVTFLWLIAVPLFDCFNVIVKRLKQGASPMQAGREHIHHILLDRGYSPFQTVCIISALSLVLGGVGVALHIFTVPESASFSLFILVFVIYFVYSQYFPTIARWLNIRSL